ncbi:MAG: hypothetical protein V1743_03845 [Nanoarchaeota archaeon]
MQQVEEKIESYLAKKYTAIKNCEKPDIPLLTGLIQENLGIYRHAAESLKEFFERVHPESALEVRVNDFIIPMVIAEEQPLTKLRITEDFEDLTPRNMSIRYDLTYALSDVTSDIVHFKVGMLVYSALLDLQGNVVYQEARVRLQHYPKLPRKLRFIHELMQSQQVIPYNRKDYNALMIKYAAANSQLFDMERIPQYEYVFLIPHGKPLPGSVSRD